MEMTGEYTIPAPRQKVWEALNDPAVLQQCIPNCEKLEKVSDNELDAAVRAKVGPVNAKFGGRVTLSNIDAPSSYTISGEGKGGAAGFAKGGADVSLEETGPAETVLRYTAKAEVGGKLAQIGSRLVQGSAKKYADDFFTRFAEVVSGPPAAEAAAPAVAPPPAASQPGPIAASGAQASPPSGTSSPIVDDNRMLWIGAALLAVIVVLFIIAI